MYRFMKEVIFPSCDWTSRETSQEFFSSISTFVLSGRSLGRSRNFTGTCKDSLRGTFIVSLQYKQEDNFSICQKPETKTRQLAFHKILLDTVSLWLPKKKAQKAKTNGFSKGAEECLVTLREDRGSPCWEAYPCHANVWENHTPRALRSQT